MIHGSEREGSRWLVVLVGKYVYTSCARTDCNDGGLFYTVDRATPTQRYSSVVVTAVCGVLAIIALIHGCVLAMVDSAIL